MAIHLLRLLLISAVGAETYDEACEEIIKHASAAAGSHNRGDQAGALASTEAAVAAFSHAAAMEPEEPQALTELT